MGGKGVGETGRDGGGQGKGRKQKGEDETEKMGHRGRGNKRELKSREWGGRRRTGQTGGEKRRLGETARDRKRKGHRQQRRREEARRAPRPEARHPPLPPAAEPGAPHPSRALPATGLEHRRAKPSQASPGRRGLPLRSRRTGRVQTSLLEPGSVPEAGTRAFLVTVRLLVLA